MTQELRQRAATRPCILVTGARQTGKTTLLRKTFPEVEYITFDNLLLTQSATESPRAFLDRYPGPVVFDEVQHVPVLFQAIKERIDQHHVNGQWFLTGSQRFELMKGVSESLAGRISILHLETLSATELRQANFSEEELRELPLRGGYPELWKNTQIDRAAWFEDYIRTYLERDLTAIVQVRHLVDFRRFLGILANRAGQLINYSDVAKLVGVSAVTIKTWVSALEVSGIIYILPPWASNSEKRLIKAPKLYFADSGLLCALLGFSTFAELERSPYLGIVWENFVFDELIKSSLARPGSDLFFYRDVSGAEVDFVYIINANRIALIEAKYTERLRTDRLSFANVAQQLPNSEVHNFVAAPIMETSPLPMAHWTVYDPRFCKIPPLAESTR